MTALASYPRSTLSTTSIQALEAAAAAHAAAAGLLELAGQGTAAGRGVAGLLYSWSEVHSSRLQVLSDGSAYLESCPAYLATIQGVSVWSARIGWRAARAVLGWIESSAGMICALGGKLRALARGRRSGRHILLERWQVQALDIAAGPRSGESEECYSLPVPAHFWGRSSRSRSRTLAICCPAHEDCSPSLVLWSNGGGLCMSCRWTCKWTRSGATLRLHGSSRPAKAPAAKAPAAKAPAGSPVGGMIATMSKAAGHAGAKLAAYADARGQLRSALSAGSALAGDVVEILERADRRSQGPKTVARAECSGRLFSHGLSDLQVLPDQLLSVSCMSRPHWQQDWQVTVQRWILIDLDDLDGLDHLDGEELGAALLAGALADTEAGDRGAVVRTGPTGLQIWIQLQEPRHSPGVWFSQECVQDWHSSLGGRLLSIAQDLGAVGGQNDLSACAAGRWGRRPGWRMTGGQLYRSHLLAAA